MPKKRKSAAVAHTEINLICCAPEQRLEQGCPEAPAAAEKAPSIQGKLVEVQFGRNMPESFRELELLEAMAVTSLRQRRHSDHSSFSEAAPADRSFGFAKTVQEQIRGALLRCEERYPIDSHQPVLYVVVRDSAVRWKQELQSLHREYFQGGEAPPMEVIEQAADDLLQRLVSAGLVAETVRITRPLWPPSGTTFFPTLSDGERKRAAAHRQHAARKLKMASVLAAGELSEEARMALLEAVEPLGRALAVENRLPEPDSLEQALMPPLDAAWKGALPLLRGFLRERSQPVPPLVAAMERI
jgi:hypothetical protein